MATIQVYLNNKKRKDGSYPKSLIVTVGSERRHERFSVILDLQQKNAM